MKVKALNEDFRYSSLPEQALLDYEAFCSAYEKKLSKPFEENRQFKLLFGNSLFLSRFAIKNPHAIPPILSSIFLQKEKTEKQFDIEIKNKLKESKNYHETLKNYKYEEYLRITLKDLNGAEQETILNELSSLANVILYHLDQILLQENRHIKSINPSKYSILAMGKLGGMELNYSSDIDLITFIENSSSIEDKHLNQKFFTEHLKILSQKLQNQDENGFLYRVDWDLRPESKAGKLVNSMEAMESYYESFGANWERQAYIKARPVAGSQKLGELFLNKINRFVYRTYLNPENIQEIQSMKGRIHQELKKSNDWNVKLGNGGIREIEFFIQAYQLIYGGKDSDLQSRSSIKTLLMLAKKAYISSDEAKVLKDAYYFFRKLEHRLQMLEEKQTHLLPFDRIKRKQIARRMGYFQEEPEEALFEFETDLKKYQDYVSSNYQKLFDDKGPSHLPARFTSRPTGIDELKYREELDTQLKKNDSFEKQLDCLRLFKKEKFSQIQSFEKFRGISRHKVLYHLSLLAESLSQKALDMAYEALYPRYGKAKDAELIGLGMGKLGGFELGYGSDLDLIFIYSNEGQTDGNKVISNSEYFAKVVQKFISILSVPTSKGFVYKIDMDLRPSGKSGPLVSSLERFIEYQNKTSQTWEKQALLRAHPLIGPAYFNRLVKEQIDTILFKKKFDKNIKNEMHRLRLRVESEIAMESKEFFDYKLGLGGLMDIEFIVQYYQLLFAKDIIKLRTPNTFDALDIMISYNLPKNSSQALLLKEAYIFYRTLESKIFLEKNISLHRLNYDDESLISIAKQLSFSSKEDLLESYQHYRSLVRKIYNEIME